MGFLLLNYSYSFIFYLTAKKQGTIIGGKSGKKWESLRTMLQTTFRGSFEHTIDDKGRVSIPVTFRKALGVHDDGLIVTKFIIDSFRCLDVYPHAEWESFEQELIVKTPRFDQTFFKIESFYLANAQECQVDKQGRILLPPHLREYAGLDKNVMFTSSLKKFRIWDKATWDRFNSDAEQQFSQNPNLFNGLNK